MEGTAWAERRPRRRRRGNGGEDADQKANKANEASEDDAFLKFVRACPADAAKTPAEMLKDFEAAKAAQEPTALVAAKKPPSCGAAADRQAKDAAAKHRKTEARVEAAKAALVSAQKELDEAVAAEAVAKEKADQAEKTRKEYYSSVIAGRGVFADLVPPALADNAELKAEVDKLQQHMARLLENLPAKQAEQPEDPARAPAEHGGQALMEPGFGDDWADEDFDVAGKAAGVDAAQAKRLLEAAAAHSKNKRAKTSS